MPLYDYKCTKCGHVFEIKQSMKDDPLRFCPECKGPIERLISAAGIIFKGSGFYVTDSQKKPESPKTKTPKKESSKKETTPKPAQEQLTPNPSLEKRGGQ